MKKPWKVARTLLFVIFLGFLAGAGYLAYQYFQLQKVYEKEGNPRPRG